MKQTKIDQRPDPKPKRRPQVYQSYVAWEGAQRLRIQHGNRLATAKAGKSNYDPALEEEFLTAREALEKQMLKLLTEYAEASAPEVWEWLRSIKGIGPTVAARLIAEIDDIAKFDNVSKLWRFCGWAVIEGEAEHLKAGEKAHFSRGAKQASFQALDQFIRQQTPLYSDIYYQEKARLREQHPEPEKAEKGPFKMAYTDAHIHRMACRKMVKIFLSHLWQVWREAEGLPVTLPYAMQIMNHTGIILPV